MVRLRVVLVSVVLTLLIFAPVFGQELEAPVEEDAADRPTVGFIFNTSNLLLDIDAYQGGFGAKFRYPESALRALVTLGYASTNSNLEVGAGVTYERPFFTGRVVPYWGLLAAAVVQGERVEVDEDNYTQTRVITGSAGAVLGAEVFIFDFLSVFGEYQLAFDVAHTAISQSVDGTVTDSSSTNYAFGAGLGNNASIGLVVYLRPLGILEAESAEE